MAIIKSGVLSNIKGSFGKVTARIVNGQNVLSQKVGFRRAANDPKSIAIRAKFRVSSKLAVAAGSLPELKAVWSAVIPKGMNFISFLVQSNFKNTEEGLLTRHNIISPLNGFPAVLASDDISSTEINVQFNSLAGAAYFNLEKEKNIKLCMVIFLHTPLNPARDQYTFLPVSFAEQPLQLDEPVSFTKALIAADQFLIESYAANIVFAALVTLDDNGTPVSCSSTVII
jgi:hypothetical protein